MAKVSAKYLPILQAFRADQLEPRHMLRGICIESQGQGALLVSCDGRCLCVVHDKEAEVGVGRYTFNPDKRAINKTLGATRAEFKNGVIELTDDYGLFIMSMAAPLMNENYTEWRHVVPVEFGHDPMPIDTSFFQKLSHLPKTGRYRPGIMIRNAKNGSLITFSGLPEIFIVMMPLRGEDTDIQKWIGDLCAKS